MTLPLRIATAGKGGSGKSVIAGTLARVLARRGNRVLALDTDPMPGLAFSVGVGAGSEAMLDGYAEHDRENRQWKLVGAADETELVRRTALEGPDGVLFLQYGKVESASNQPIMSSMQAFWRVTQKVAPGEWTIVQDLAAGTRQAYAGWASSTDVFLLVVEPSQKSILAARRLTAMKEVAPNARFFLVPNKVASDEDEQLVTDALPQFTPLVTVPLDAAVAASDRLGVAPIDYAPYCPTVQAVIEIAARLESLAEVGG